MREVKRMAKIGEKVKVVDAGFVPKTGGNPEYKNGDILTVIGIYHDSQVRYAEGMSDDRRARVLNPDEYVVLEGENEMKFKVGDKVRGTAGIYAFTNERMTKATVTEVYESGTMRICVDEHLDGENMGKSFTVEQKYFEPYIFTLSDLKPCMVVKIRDGQLFLVSQLESGLGLVKEREGESLYFGDFNDDLTFKVSNRYDIIEVYGYRKDFLINSLDLSSVNRELLWKREEPKPKRKMTVAEICKELGQEIKIVKGE